MTHAVILHNPRCSKSRETLALLTEKGVDVKVIEYLKDTPDAAMLKQILSLLNLSARALMRTKEDEYKTLGLDDESLSEDMLIDAMVATPKLIERPIVLANDKAAIGRPPVSVLDIL